MLVLVAPDKFKGSLSADQAARAIAQGVIARRPDARVELCPLADGGEGTLTALEAALGGELREARVTGPLGQPRVARWLFISQSRTAVIESAEAVGLGWVAPELRNPLSATSYGLGELVRAALDAGALRIVVGLGGSATTDGGVGMAQALGVGFGGAPVPLAGRDLASIDAIDFRALDARLAQSEIIGACDVDNGLLGPNGAALTYARQKGASEAEAQWLERALAVLAKRVPADPLTPGAGAAGGLGWGLVAFLGAKLGSGADFVLDAVGFDARLARADAVLTGEGRLDAQSLRGKVVAAVASRARRAGVPVLAIAGSVALAPAELRELGVTLALSLTSDGVSEAEAKSRAAELVLARAKEASDSLGPT